MRPVLLALLCPLLILPANARLGETEAQCVVRYGPVLDRATSQEAGIALPLLSFTKNGYMFDATMLKGKVAHLVIQKADSAEFSDNEVAIFLTSNSAGQKWTEQVDTPTKPRWLRDDGSEAEYDRLHHWITLSSKDYLVAKEAAKRNEESQKTQGF